MKNLLFLLLAVTLFACKKDNTSNRVQVPVNGGVVNSYFLYLVNDRPYTSNDFNDTLRIKINDVLVSGVNAGTNKYQHINKVKTGDKISIYYNPGKTISGTTQIIDENILNLYLDDKPFVETKCRCILNVTKVVQ
jgi:hypothetical protein